jgi:hypothetical protein
VVTETPEAVRSDVRVVVMVMLLKVRIAGRADIRVLTEIASAPW